MIWFGENGCEIGVDQEGDIGGYKKKRQDKAHVSNNTHTVHSRRQRQLLTW